MTKTKHTPGPWKVQKPDSQSYAHTITGNGFWIADVAHGAIKDDDVANAHLIAAAPELLEALKKCLPRMHPTHPEYENAVAVIAKAEGGGK